MGSSVFEKREQHLTHLGSCELLLKMLPVLSSTFKTNNIVPVQAWRASALIVLSPWERGGKSRILLVLMERKEGDSENRVAERDWTARECLRARAGETKVRTEHTRKRRERERYNLLPPKRTFGSAP